MVTIATFEIPLVKRVLLASIFLFFPWTAFGDVPPLCNELARFSCAPGNYKDQTGFVKSSTEIQRFMSNYSEKSRVQLNEKFKKILNDPENSYFKELAISGLGLKNSPQCSSSKANDVTACQENLLEGLTALVQKQALSPLMPTASLQRMGSLSDAGYILQNEIYQGVLNDLNRQAQTDLSNPEVEKKIKEKIFPNIKSLIAERINQLSIPDEQKKFMINKVKSIQFAGSNCSEIGGGNGHGGSGGQLISTLLIPNAFYDPGRNTFKYCSGFLLQSTSEFQIAMFIAHELSHSIDPCGLSSGPSDMSFKYKNSDDLKKMEQEFPLKNIISCLRDPRSVEARNLAAGQGQGVTPNGYGGGYPGGAGMAQGPPSPLKPSFCVSDQITESFADWMAAEVMPQYIEKNYKLTPEQYREGYANVFRTSCWAYPDTSDNFNWDVHPAIGRRINKILLVNPKLRTQMGCPEKHPENIYCNSEKPLDSAAAPVQTAPQPAAGTGNTQGMGGAR
ncbi:MAG: hypothetical protein ACXVB4_09175 [Pseudobdellovibrionaceae bacterium]